MTTLFKHQQELVNRNPERRGIFFGVGCGKTLTAIALAKKNKVVPLIIVPKALKENWLRELIKHDAHGEVVTKEYFRDHVKQLSPRKAVIVDEAQFFSSPKSGMTKALLWYCKQHRVKYRWLLTGTPYRTTPWSVFTLAKHLGVEWNYWNFRQRYFSEFRMGQRIISTPKKGIEKDMAALIRTIGDMVKLDEVIDLPPQVFEVEYFKLTQDQERAIKQIEEPLPIVRYGQEHQIANGVWKGNEYEEGRFFSCQKNDRIIDLAEEYCDDKLAIFCRYNLQIDYFKQKFEELGKKVWVIRGDVKDRHLVVDDIENTEAGIVLVQSDTAVGYQLPSIRTFIFASLSWSYVNFIQAVGRNSRIDKPARNLYITMVTRGTVDEEVYKAIKRGENFQAAIYD